VASHRKRKKNISCLEDNGIVMEDDSGMLQHAMEFYKKLFGTETKENIKVGEDFWSDDEKITREETEALEVELSENEIRRAIFESYAEGALDQMVSLSSSTKTSGLLLKQIS
jgi:uncharacterized glyoxalase superfamily protein PhnB